MPTPVLIQVTERVLHISVQACVVVAVIVLVQTLFRRRLAPGTCHALWFLLLIRLALPISIPSPVSVFNLHPDASIRDSRQASTALAVAESASVICERKDVNEGEAQTGTDPSSKRILDTFRAKDTMPSTAALQQQTSQSANAAQTGGFVLPRALWPAALGWVWLAGVVCLLSRFCWQNLKVWVQLRQSSQIVDADLNALLLMCAQQIGVRQVPRLLETRVVRSPALYGLFRPRLLLPLGMASQWSAPDLRFIFLHELAHIRRCDMGVTWASGLLLAVHWFNPVLWWACGRLRVDRELACDALVLARMNPGENRLYGEAILRILSSLTRPSPVPGAVGVVEDMRQMKQRMRQIASFRPAPRRPWVTLLLFGALGLTTLTEAQLSKAQPTLPVPATNSAPPTPIASEKPSASSPSPIPESLAVLRARQLIELGQLDAAEARLQEVVRDHPDDRDARYHLRIIQEARLVQESRNRPGPRKERGLRRSSGRTLIQQKLQEIVFDGVVYDQLPLSEVIRDLNTRSTQSDAEGRGVNFIVNLNAPSGREPSIDPKTGLPFPAGSGRPPGNLNQVLVTLRLEHVHLRDLLDAIVRVATFPIHYTIEDYAVVFSAAPSDTQKLFTRTYRVDPNAFLAGLTNIAPQVTANTQPSNSAEPGDLTNPSPEGYSSTLIARMRDFFSVAGVNFSPKSVAASGAMGFPPAEGKAIFFNDRTGLLLVRATMEDLDIIEKAVQVLNSVPPQVTIDARFIEMGPEDLKPGTVVAPNRQVPVLADIPVLGRLFRSDLADQSGSKAVLSRSERNALLRTLQQRPKAELATPRVTTLSGRQIRAEIPGLGLMLDVLPTVKPDGLLVQLDVGFTLSPIRSASESDGNLAQPSPGAVQEDPAAPLRVTTVTAVQDGQTLVLGPFPSETRGPDRRLLLLITPVIIDSAGNPVHEPE